MTRLERRYRRWLRALPASYRAVWEADMVATFLASTLAEIDDPQQAQYVVDSGRPSWPEVASVLALAVRLRLGGATASARAFAWGEAARRVALVVLLINATLATMTVGLSLWFPGGFLELMWALAGLVWLAAFLALLWGRRRAAGVLAVAGLLHDTASHVGMRLADPGGGPAVADSAALIVTGLLLHALAGFHRDAPPVRRKPWLAALAVGLAVSPTLPALAVSQPDGLGLLLDRDAVYCLLITAATAVHLGGRVLGRDHGPAWPLALALLAVAVVVPRVVSAAEFTADPAQWMASAVPIAGIAEATVVIIAGVVLATLAGRGLRQLPLSSPLSSTGGR